MLNKIIAPMTIKEFKTKMDNSETFVIKSKKNKFNNLITLDEIEATINNGCNWNVPVSIIYHGARQLYISGDVAWSPQALNKTKVKEMIEANNSFMMMNQSQINKQVAELVTSIENEFDMFGDAHIYVSPCADATGYKAHRDRPQHKIYLQIEGTSNWQIFDHKDLDEEIAFLEEEDENKHLVEKMNFELKAGDLLYMPPDTFHKVKNYEGARISLSIPFNTSDYGGMNKMDRTYIPLKDIWNNATLPQ
jgi:ribosomal protein L16 Arg81 hydroxylase